MIKKILELDLNPILARVERVSIDRYERDFKIYLKSLKNIKPPESKEEYLEFLIEFLIEKIEINLDSIEKLNFTYGRFKKEYNRASSKSERDRILIDYNRRLSSKELNTQALNRYFDDSALSDRYQKKLSNFERDIIFILGRVGALGKYLFKDLTLEIFTIKWRRVNFEHIAILTLNYRGDSRVLTALLKSLSKMIESAPIYEGLIRDSILKFIYRASLDIRRDTWIQVQSLKLLSYLSKESLKIVIEKRLLHQERAKDDIFVRHRAILLLGEHFPNSKELIELAKRDSSGYVREAFVEIVPNLKNPSNYLREILEQDSSKQTRARAILKLKKLLNTREFFKVVDILIHSLKIERDEFVLRVALKVVSESIEEIKFSPLKRVWLSRFKEAIERFNLTTASIRVKQEASKSYQKLEILYRYSHLYRELESFTKSMKLNSKAKIPKEISSRYSLQTLAKTLSLISQRDFSYQIIVKKRKLILIKGDIFRTKLWRVLYEFLNPAPDKREAFTHTIARDFEGDILIPSAIMSEVTKTKVPAEPFLISKFGNYRPYLPLLDIVDSTLSLTQKEVKIYSFEGITKVLSPKNIFKRVFAKLKLIFKFNSISKLRDLENSSYIEELERLGFDIEFKSNTQIDRDVAKLFPILIPSIDSNLYIEFERYFFSVYQNSLFDLGIFVSTLALIFFGRNFYLSYSLKKARNSIPLVVGGWGSRGKSGTERVKAGLFNALGYSMVSKTTGCEAMFLYSYGLSKTYEMFLFRPYDKATIWEQYNLVKLAKRLNCDIFLWECMGLTPDYIDILQKKWMRDDISTITNTYPDHEDLQGPAGINTPDVMRNFIPKNSTLITTEEEMSPILEDASREYNTEFKAIGWLEAGLLSDEIVNRFPYEEHPYNIALVLELAKELGLEEDFALKEMADNVVSDLGVLKSFPISKIDDRELEFTNGMSANERFAALQNFERMGFNEVQKERVITSTVINNRADRVARSKVFANIIAKDFSANLHFLIGTNLTGFIGYLREAFEDYSQNLTLFQDGNPRDNFIEFAKFYKIPTTESEIKLEFERDFYKKFRELEIKLEQNSDPKEVDREFKELILSSILERFVTIDNPYILGDEIIEIIANRTPKGYLNRIIGIQNIKGAGLDFVYKWLDWEAIYLSMEKLKSKDEAIAISGLKELSTIKNFTILAKESLRESIESAKSSQNAQSELFHNELEAILFNLKKSDLPKDSKDRERNRFVDIFANFLESLLDVKDAIKRRKRADAIYEELIQEQISYQRAIEELKGINKRQKGGWILS